MKYLMIFIGAIVYLGLILMFSRKARIQKPFFHIISFIIIYLSLILFPLKGFLLGSTFFLIHMLIYYFFYRVSAFESSIYTFLTFFIVVTSSMLATYFTIWFRGVFIDYRLGFGNKDILYILAMTLIIAIISYIIINTLKYMSRNFQSIRRRQVLFYAVNITIILFLLVYLRFSIANAINIAKNSGPSISLYMVLNMFLTIVLYIWMFNRVNNFFFDGDSEHVGEKSLDSKRRGAENLLRLMAQSANNNSPMTVIYIEFSGIKKIQNEFGGKEAARAISELSDIVKSNAVDDILIKVKEDELLLCLADKNENEAIMVWNDIEYGIRDFNTANYDRYFVSAYTGFTEFDPNSHETVSKLLSEAKKNVRVAK